MPFESVPTTRIGASDGLLRAARDDAELRSWLGVKILHRSKRRWSNRGIENLALTFRHPHGPPQKRSSRVPAP